MKKIILGVILLIVALTITILHREYKDNYIITFLYAALRILSLVAIIRFVIKKNKTTTP
jgi:hypothetical protein